MKALIPRDIWGATLIFVWAVLILLLLWPLADVLRASLMKEGHFSLAQYAAVFLEPKYQSGLINTFIVGFGGMIGAMVLGIPLAFVVARFNIRGRRAIELLSLIALVSPPFIGAYSWIVLFGARGWVRLALRDVGIDIPPIYGAAGVILVFSLKFFPNVFLLCVSAFAAVNRSLEEAAESLGYSPAQRLFRVTLPLIMPAIMASGLLTFVLSIADFGTPQLIGRDFQVLATQAYTLYSAEMGENPGQASALSLVLVAISLLLVMAQRWAMRRNVFHSSGTKVPVVIEARGMKALGLHALAYGIVLLGSVPAITAIIFSFRNTRGPVFQPGFGLQSYQRIIERVPDAIVNTLIYSASAVAAIVVVGTLLGYLLVRRPSPATSLLDVVLVIPYVVPGIVIGIAYVASFNTPPLVLTGTGMIIVLTIFVRRLPYAARAVSASLKQVSPSLEEAAMSLGYGPGRAFLKVTAPLILPGILSGALMSLVTAMNELSSSLVLYVGGTVTMPVRIYIAVIDGDYGVAAALATILIVLTSIAVCIASYVGRGRPLA